MVDNSQNATSINSPVVSVADETINIQADEALRSESASPCTTYQVHWELINYGCSTGYALMIYVNDVLKVVIGDEEGSDSFEVNAGDEVYAIVFSCNIAVLTGTYFDEYGYSGVNGSVEVNWDNLTIIGVALPE